MANNLTGTLEQRVEGALKVAFDYGACDGESHKQWVIDQMVRALTGDKYEEWVYKFNFGVDGEDSYLWDEGRTPLP